MRIAYLATEYVSHAKAAAGNRRALTHAGYELVDDPSDAELVVLHDEPPSWAGWLERRPVLRERYLIGYGVWETDRLPAVYRDALPFVREVWTASQHCARLFSEAGATVAVIPHLIEPRAPSPRALARMHARLGTSAFCFYCISDGYNPRKNLAAMLAAFAQVRAQHGARVALVVKQYARPISLAGHDGVVSIDEPLDEDAIAALHACCRVYLSSHRGEAWGLGISEALAAGNVAIATGWSGNLDYQNDQNSLLLGYQLRAVREDEIAFAPALLEPGMRWAEIEPDALAAQMRACLGGAEPPLRADDRVLDLRRRFGIEALAARMRERLGAVVAQRARAPSPRAERRIGLFHHAGESEAVIVGRRVAVDGLAAALARHGQRHRYELFASPAELAALEPRLPLDRGPLTLRDRRALAGEGAFDAWHESQLDGYAPFALREARAGGWPITLLHHTLSYKELLHDEYLRLLLARPRSYDCLVCSSEPARRALTELLAHVAEGCANAFGATIAYRGRTEVIPLGVDVERFRPRDRAAARARFELPADAFVLLWVGRLSAIDKADLVPLCELVGEIARAHPRLLLVCAGRQRAGERYGDVIRDYAQGRGFGAHVRVLSEVEGGLEQLYAAADVFVSPADNLQESFGIAPVEAMASGVPQIASDWDGYRDTIEHEATGLLVPTYWARCSGDLEASAMLHASAFEHLTLAQSVAVDVRALRQAIVRLLEDEPLRRAMSERSRERAVRLYGWPAIVARYEALWSELADDARASTHQPERALDYVRPPYARAFAHYPSRMLDDASALRLTDRGRALLSGAAARLSGSAPDGAELPLHYNRDWHYLDVALLQRVLRGIVALDQQGEPMSLGRLAAVITKSTPGARDAALRCALWLLKYGYVELVT